MKMSLKVLDIIVKKILFGEEENIGYLIFNSADGKTLKKFKINSPYAEKITRKNLLTENYDYSSFDFPDYLSRIQKGLSKDFGFGKKVLLRKRDLSPKVKKALLNQYAREY